MKKYLLDAEFRYRVVPQGTYDSGSESKKVTIGVFDDLNEALKKGNEVVTKLEKDGKFSFRNKFKKNDYNGKPTRLVCDFSQKHKVEVFIHLETLRYDDLDAVMTNAFSSQEEYDKWANS